MRMRAILCSFALPMLTLLLAACAGTRTTDVETRSSPPATGAPVRNPEARPAETRPAPTAAPTPSATAKKGGYYKDDGPGDNPPPDMASIPDAGPRTEPLHRYANRPYVALGQSYVPRQEIAPYRESGIASWYGRRFHGVRTSSGERYDMYGMTAAHPTLPIPSYVRVTNVDNGKSVVVRINDRGPFHADRVIDLSYTAAWKLGYVSKGSTRVEVEAIVPEDVTMLGRNVPPVVPPRAAADVSAAPETQQVAVEAQAVEAASARASAISDTAAAPVGIYLQLGAFTSNRNAEDFRDYARQELGNLKQLLIIIADVDKDRERFRLHLGPFSSAGAAREMADRIAGKLKLKPFLVQR